MLKTFLLLYFILVYKCCIVVSFKLCIYMECKQIGIVFSFTWSDTYF